MTDSEFSRKTVEFLIEKYDKNGDREISFDEFDDLFYYLNEEHEDFLKIDTDDSGVGLNLTKFTRNTF